MRNVGLVALIVSVASMMSSFMVDFGDTQFYLAGVALIAVTVAACILLHQPEAVSGERGRAMQKSLRAAAEALSVRLGSILKFQ